MDMVDVKVDVASDVEGRIAVLVTGLTDVVSPQRPTARVLCI
jgi:hypothetical protein